MALLVLGLSLAGCSNSSTMIVGETVVRDEIAGHRLLVQLEAAQPGTSVRFAHPLAGEEELLTQRFDALLAELAYGRPKGRRLVHVLEVEDRQRLAAALARGLTHAGPRERVRFWLSIEDDAHTPWFTPVSRHTRGVAFVETDGRLHLVFDLLDERVDPEDLDAHDPTEQAQTRARLVSETGEDLGQGEGASKLWVAWPLLAAAATPDRPDADASADANVEADANAAKLELLDELLRDDIIDREEYERRRARLGPETRQ
ncbi:hypothetical protein ACNOYE_20355 [Nannocystaceae bacterium ST9]